MPDRRGSRFRCEGTGEADGTLLCIGEDGLIDQAGESNGCEEKQPGNEVVHEEKINVNRTDASSRWF